MESSGCDDADVRLPPRKRLLAVLKKQSFSEGTSQSSQENTPSPSLSPSIGQSPTSTSPLSEFDLRLSNLLKSYKNGSNMSPEEIALAAKSAADGAAKVAQAARAAAEEKAAIAAKAVAAAKTALDLVAYDEPSDRSKHHKKNKLKKHVPVQLFYDEFEPIENCGDEELARRLHRAMNSSPRISKHPPKKLKISSPYDKSVVSNGTIIRDEDVKLPNGEQAKGGMDCEGSNGESHTVVANEKMSESSKDDAVEMDSCEAESSHTREKVNEGLDCSSINGRKRGRIKQKKLPLSIVCSSKDQAEPNEELKLSNTLLTRDRTVNSSSRHLSLPSVDSMTPMEVAPTWKCQDFKVSECIKQDKLVQS